MPRLVRTYRHSGREFKRCENRRQCGKLAVYRILGGVNHMTDQSEPKKISLADAVKQKLAQKKQQQAGGGKQQSFTPGGGKQLKDQNNSKKTMTTRKKLGG